MEPKSVMLGEERETVPLETEGGRPQFTPVQGGERRERREERWGRLV